ncbi:MAG: PD-(D/E)XK nuclease-like domain-containing protein, partial [Bacteroidetes bacterium]|nr:PD-(D/E)XK nuclease-like domain-containing protein [Bacteroidota bacterium]
NQLVVDIKSTSCRTLEEFTKSCLKYDYDRQAAFYLDSLGMKGAAERRFAFVAIQKVKPFHVWKIEYLGDSDFIEYGRRKYQALLSQWRHRESLGLSFVPSTWNAGLLPNDKGSLGALAT